MIGFFLTSSVFFSAGSAGTVSTSGLAAGLGDNRVSMLDTSTSLPSYLALRVAGFPDIFYAINVSVLCLVASAISFLF